jgi:hypothetical protein
VPLAIGMSDNIRDADAMAFAARFYATVADGQSVEGAYRVAKVAMEFSGLPMPTCRSLSTTQPSTRQTSC